MMVKFVASVVTSVTVTPKITFGDQSHGTR